MSHYPPMDGLSRNNQKNPDDNGTQFVKKVHQTFGIVTMLSQASYYRAPNPLLSI